MADYHEYLQITDARNKADYHEYLQITDARNKAAQKVKAK